MIDVGAATVDARPFRTACRETRAEARIGSDLDVIADAVRRKLGTELSALLLVGGYARGEGGVVARATELGPYNDYDLVAVVRGRADVHRAPLLALGHHLTEALGIEVELWPVARADLSSLPPTLFWLDVALGAVDVIAGDPGMVQHLRRLEVRDIPLAEGARLLMNRAVGLALTNLEEADRDFRRARHGHKAILACGDALLLAADLYEATIERRARALDGQRAAPGVGDDLADAYTDAARFRQRPDLWTPPPPFGRDGEEAWYARVRALVAEKHLAFEARRIGTPTTAVGYAAYGDSLAIAGPDTTIAPLAALRAALRGRAPVLPYVGHPRDRLARVAVALAYGHDLAGCRAIATRLLGLPPNASDDAIHRSLRRLVEVAG